MRQTDKDSLSRPRIRQQLNASRGMCGGAQWTVRITQIQQIQQDQAWQRTADQPCLCSRSESVQKIKHTLEADATLILTKSCGTPDVGKQACIGK